MKKEILLELIERAKLEEIGIAIETNNPSRLQIFIDEAMKGTNSGLMACAADANHLFLVKKSVELPA